MRNFLLRLLLLVPVSLVLSPVAMAQKQASEKIKPQWTHKLPEPTNSSFMYEIVTATAPTLDAARNQCIAELIANSGMKQGVVAISDNKSSQEVSQVWENGKLTERVTGNSLTTTHAQYDAVKLYVESIAEYWERDSNGDYYLTKLYAKSELGQAPLFDNVELTTKYGARGLWRSLLIPGWGQFYKGSYLKGGLILGGCAVLAGGIVFTESRRADYVAKMSQTHDNNLINSYRNKRDIYATSRNICIGAVAALYIYNLVDAIVAPGAQRIVVKKRNDGTTATLTAAPTATMQGDLCLTTQLTF